MPWYLPSRRGVSGYLSSGRSACLTDAECKGKCRLDDACHDICLLDECLRHPDTVHLIHAECQGKWDLDETYDGTPHIGNRVVTVEASKHDRQGTVHCSKDY